MLKCYDCYVCPTQYYTGWLGIGAKRNLIYMEMRSCTKMIIILLESYTNQVFITFITTAQ